MKEKTKEIKRYSTLHVGILRGYQYWDMSFLPELYVNSF